MSITHTHKHEHEHEHGHIHDHTRSHDSGERGIAAAEPAGVSKKDAALLTYMLEHNRQQARELLETGRRLADAGNNEAAEYIDSAVHYFDHANESLEKAAAALK